MLKINPSAAEPSNPNTVPQAPTTRLYLISFIIYIGKVGPSFACINSARGAEIMVANRHLFPNLEKRLLQLKLLLPPGVLNE